MPALPAPAAAGMEKPAGLDRSRSSGARAFHLVSYGEAIEHRHKAMMLPACLSLPNYGWIADNPAAKDPSFHIWRAYAPTRDWESIAREWLSAEGDPQAEQAFFNDVFGLEYEGAAEAPPWEDSHSSSWSRSFCCSIGGSIDRRLDSRSDNLAKNAKIMPRIPAIMGMIKCTAALCAAPTGVGWLRSSSRGC